MYSFSPPHQLWLGKGEEREGEKGEGGEEKGGSYSNVQLLSPHQLWLGKGEEREGKERERWRIDEVAVHSLTTGHTYLFPWGKWVEPGRQYCLEAAELESSGNTSTLAPGTLAPGTPVTSTPSTESGLVGECFHPLKLSEHLAIFERRAGVGQFPEAIHVSCKCSCHNPVDIPFHKK